MSTSKLQQRDLLPELAETSSHPARPVVGGCPAENGHLPSSCALSRAPWDGPISAFGRKPSPWLPFRTASLAWGIVKLLVDISKEPVLAPDWLDQTSFQRTSLTPKGHTAQFSHFFAQVGLMAGFVLVSSRSSPLHCPSSVKPYLLDGADGPRCLTLST